MSQCSANKLCKANKHSMLSITHLIKKVGINPPKNKIQGEVTPQNPCTASQNSGAGNPSTRNNHVKITILVS
jgi:hypothetical protein